MNIMKFKLNLNLKFMQKEYSKNIIELNNET